MPGQNHIKPYFYFIILKTKFRYMPVERKRRTLLQYLVYGIYISFIETVQNRSIYIAINMTYLLLQ